MARPKLSGRAVPSACSRRSAVVAGMSYSSQCVEDARRMGVLHDEGVAARALRRARPRGRRRNVGAAARERPRNRLAVVKCGSCEDEDHTVARNSRSGRGVRAGPLRPRPPIRQSTGRTNRRAGSRTEAPLAEGVLLITNDQCAAVANYSAMLARNSAPKLGITNLAARANPYAAVSCSPRESDWYRRHICWDVLSRRRQVCMPTCRRGLYQGRVPLPYDLFFDAMPTGHPEFFPSLRTCQRAPHPRLRPRGSGACGRTAD